MVGDRVLLEMRDSSEFAVIVSDKDREEWLEARRHVVTGSGVATLMGMNPFKAPDQLLEDYLGTGKPFFPNRKMLWGSFAETWVGKSLASCIGEGKNRYMYLEENLFRVPYRSPLGATTDGYIRKGQDPLLSHMGLHKFVWETSPSGHKANWERFRGACGEMLAQKGSKLYVEIKCVGESQLKYWNSVKDGPPRYYWAQCQVQLHVLDIDKMVIVAKVGGNDIRGHVVERDEAFLEEAVSCATEFMDKVREGREL